MRFLDSVFAYMYPRYQDAFIVRMYVREEGKNEFIADELFWGCYDYGGDCHTHIGNQPFTEKYIFDFVGNCVIETDGAVFYSVGA